MTGLGAAVPPPPLLMSEHGSRKESAVLILDFDGVVCDALDECALVTWLGKPGNEPEATGQASLKRLPPEFRSVFRHVRDYARLLDHFMVAHLPGASTVRSQAEFDALFASIPADEVATFVRRASAARDLLRERDAQFWLGMHTLYPGIAELLVRHAGRTAIVTAKDTLSVRAILDFHGLGHTVAAVVGECSDKVGAVRELCEQAGIPPSAAVFIDDNLTNVRRVAATGARSLWARWGYGTPEHAAEAAALRIPEIRLADLASVTV